MEEMPWEDVTLGLRRLHVNMGHARQDDMMRVLRLGKARSKALEACRNFFCPECAHQTAPRIQRTSKPRRTSFFGEEVAIDLLEVLLPDRTPVTGVIM
jgi:hypothetical protein